MWSTPIPVLSYWIAHKKWSRRRSAVRPGYYQSRRKSTVFRVIDALSLLVPRDAISHVVTVTPRPPLVYKTHAISQTKNARLRRTLHRSGLLFASGVRQSNNKANRFPHLGQPCSTTQFHFASLAFSCSNVEFLPSSCSRRSRTSIELAFSPAACS